MNSLARVLAFVMLATPAFAQKTTQIHPGNGGSPHVRTEWTVAGANISIEYGRPFLKGRTIGKEIVPFGQVWRFGADEETQLKTDKPLQIGTVTVPAGTVSLWVNPASADKWQLVINKQTGQGGTEYDQSADLGRVDMKVEKNPKTVEQLTISIDPGASGGTLRAEWGDVRASVPFTVVK